MGYMINLTKNILMIPAVIKKIYDAKISSLPEVKIWGDGKSRREFMFSSDLADFISFAIKKIDKIPQNINVGVGLIIQLMSIIK